MGEKVDEVIELVLLDRSGPIVVKVVTLSRFQAREEEPAPVDFSGEVGSVEVQTLCEQDRREGRSKRGLSHDDLYCLEKLRLRVVTQL